MGGQQSSPLLVPHAHFPYALSSRYTRTHSVTLRLEPCFWSHAHREPLEIRDATTNLTMFRIPSTHKKSKRLLDMYNAPVATVTSHRRSTTTTTTTIVPTTSHYADDPQHHYHACTVETEVLDGAYVVARATWSDHTTITCEGDWCGPHAIDFWLETTDAPASRIARVHTDALDAMNDSYVLAIASGVDVALMLLICAAIDDAVSPLLTLRYRGATATRRTSRMEIAKPSMRRSDAIPVPA